jgi:hypothetical protein
MLALPYHGFTGNLDGASSIPARWDFPAGAEK